MLNPVSMTYSGYSNNKVIFLYIISCSFLFPSACHNLDGPIFLSNGWQSSKLMLNDSVLSNIKHGAGINKIKHCLNSKDGLH